MTAPTDRARMISHERGKVPVPADIRRALRALPVEEAKRIVGGYNETYLALREDGGFATPAAIDRVRDRLRFGPERPRPTREDAMLDKGDLEREGG